MDEGGWARARALQADVRRMVEGFVTTSSSSSDERRPRFTVSCGEPHTRRWEGERGLYRVMCVVVDVDPPTVAKAVAALLKEQGLMLEPDQETTERRTPVVVESTLHAIQRATTY